MIKINVGFSRKVGEANYGSRGASANLELEIDSSLAGEPDRLRDKVRQAFVLVKASVDEELKVSNLVSNDESDAKSKSSHRNGRSSPRDEARRATTSQLRAIYAIADEQELFLPSLLQEKYRIDDPAQLSVVEASKLIDELKSHAFASHSVGSQ